ncbi:MAG: heparan-alpha-glucosaminide N-acetyltransferase domain-containing protein [Vicinamibacterales bacterium]
MRFPRPVRASTSELPGVPEQRLTAIDATRGAVMVIMALDHVRDFIHHGAMVASPTDLASTTPVLFMTRWITHLCAPAFMFLAGTSAYLWQRRSASTTMGLSRFLVVRGLVLIALELTVMRVAYDFDLTMRDPVLLIVLWVLGACMVALAALVWLPRTWLAAGSVAVIALHNLLDGIRAARLGAWAPAWILVHQVGAFPVGGLLVIVGYPLVPWVAVMALGYASGPAFDWPPGRRRTVLVTAGLAAVAAFVALRAVNGYGDPSPWQPQASGVLTALSFLDTTKYPPSLMFLLMTLGPLWLALAAFEGGVPRGMRFLVVFGRVPLFFFVAHFYLAHMAAVGLAWLRYGAATWTFAFHPVPSMGGPRELFPADFGFGLAGAYAVWFGVVLVLYPACRRLAVLKAERRYAWLSYL